VQEIISEFQIEVSLPKWVTILDNSTVPETEAAIRAADMHAPFLCKPEAACGKAYSHDMAVFSSAEQLAGFAVPPPFTIQEFRNHGGVVLKVYVLGPHWFVYPGPSIADTEATTGLRAFNSQELKHTAGAGEEARQAALDALKARRSLVDALVAGVGKKLGLSLFGVDILLEAAPGNRVYVVDVNYFPGYAGVEDMHNKLADHIISRAKEALSY
jgi:inositol-1,3,4-trisphosphate 5/6-kinase/inositol-tetrakisphosphate 1-kinase